MFSAMYGNFNLYQHQILMMCLLTCFQALEFDSETDEIARLSAFVTQLLGFALFMEMLAHTVKSSNEGKYMANLKYIRSIQPMLQ